MRIKLDGLNEVSQQYRQTQTEKVKSGFPNADLNYFLRVSTEMGILALDKGAYSVHEEYLDYYKAKGTELVFDF